MKPLSPTKNVETGYLRSHFSPVLMILSLSQEIFLDVVVYNLKLDIVAIKSK
jgi:hypothetical protein